MSQTEPAALENAEAIIEMFGGIRPMATKINVPVTTVQGWKKRNVIPGTRREEILRVAQQLGLDVAKIMQPGQSAMQGSGANIPETVANENNGRAPLNLSTPLRTEEAILSARRPGTLESELMRTERRAVAKSAAINLFLVLLAIIAAVLLLLPQSERRLDALESDISAIQKKQSFLSSLIPDDIEARFAALQVQISGYQPSLGSALGKAQDISRDVFGPGAATFQQRAERLEGHVTHITGLSAPANLDALVTRLQALGESALGQAQLDQASAHLNSLLAGVPEGDPVQAEQVLQNVSQDPALAQTFAGVPPQDMKAAALLLGMTQFRESLSRDNQSFENDLALLKKLVGTEDIELTAAIDRLAPYAQQGVLTPTGLSQEFRVLTGDIVVASLQGEEISIRDKAQARLGEILQVEKNGEPVSGTETQKTLARSEKMLDEGNVEGALAHMQTLDGAALVAAQPWITRAQATLLAQKFKRMLTNSIGTRGSAGTPIYNGGGPLLPGARGLNIPSSGLVETPSPDTPENYNPNTGALPEGPQ
ncbi:MAG: mitofilin family membrane protein [Alphaproteobacteria bacterium]